MDFEIKDNTTLATAAIPEKASLLEFFPPCILARLVYNIGERYFHTLNALNYEFSKKNVKYSDQVCTNGIVKFANAALREADEFVFGESWIKGSGKVQGDLDFTRAPLSSTVLGIQRLVERVVRVAMAIIEILAGIFDAIFVIGIALILCIPAAMVLGLGKTGGELGDKASEIYRRNFEHREPVYANPIGRDGSDIGISIANVSHLGGDC